MQDNNNTRRIKSGSKKGALNTTIKNEEKIKEKKIKKSTRVYVIASFLDKIKKNI